MEHRIFVDTNIFIYSLFNVSQQKHSKCKDLFIKASLGKVSLWTTEWVVAELIWFLQKSKLKWDDIRKIIISGLLSTKGLDVKDGKRLLQAMKSSKTANDFVDYINISLAQEAGINKGYSFDKGLDKTKSFKRLEP